MGYYMEQVDSKFSMTLENEDKAFKALRDHLKDVQAKNRSLGWICLSDAIRHKAFHYLMSECRWDTEENVEGEIVDIQFNGEKLSGDELEIFEVIAPYVDEGSFIEMHGENNDMWRWVFEGGKCKEIHPEIKW